MSCLGGEVFDSEGQVAQCLGEKGLHLQCDRSARRRAIGPLRTRDCPRGAAAGAPSCRPASIWAPRSDHAARLVVCKNIGTDVN